MRSERILIVEDSKLERESLGAMLTARNFDVTLAASAEEALSYTEDAPFDIILTDLRMPKMNGIDLLKKAKEIDPQTGVIIITAYGTIDSAIEALREGAYDYLTKPIDSNRLIITLRNLLEKRIIEAENVRLQNELQKTYKFSNIIGTSSKMREVYELISNVADIKTTIIIRGESGTGKELVAEAVHYNGPRRHKPLIKVHCAALTETLMESELFGHEKGAFTDAIRQKQGRFELADGGTLFLDEVGELSQSVQVKLLRVLQEGEFERVGGTVTIKVDVRIIAATNRNLEEEIKKGNFREDLYYRLHVLPIRLPNLCERKEDIPELVKHFIKKYNKNRKTEVDNVTPEAMKILIDYSWPGNVRELENAIEHSMALTKERLISAEHLPSQLQTKTKELWGLIPPEVETLEEMESRFILASLNSHKWNRTKTAESLGIDRTTLYQKIKKYKLEETKSLK